uniref:Uncharacterized protein n=1 Tax=Caenorhabditis japonica TaxID=281687 RepID=A0A8R1J379_CAEJA
MYSDNELLQELLSEDVRDDWLEVQNAATSNDELEKIQRVIAKVSCQDQDLFKAGKEVESINPATSFAFSNFLLRFISHFQNLPENHKNYTNTMLILKIIAENAGNPRKSIGLDGTVEISVAIETARNNLIKDLLEKATNLYPNDGKSRTISARDLLDGVILTEENLESPEFKEPEFLKMKKKWSTSQHVENGAKRADKCGCISRQVESCADGTKII